MFMNSDLPTDELKLLENIIYIPNTFFFISHSTIIHRWLLLIIYTLSFLGSFE